MNKPKVVIEVMDSMTTRWSYKLFIASSIAAALYVLIAVVSSNDWGNPWSWWFAGSAITILCVHGFLFITNLIRNNQ